MKRLLITGTSGMLGSNMAAEIGNKYEVFGIDVLCANSALKNQFRIDLKEKEKVKEIIDSVNPDFVVHCAALTKVDECEKKVKEAYESNVTATENLASAVRPHTRFLYISTDSVFDGKRGGYAEADTPSPLNNYARTKLEAEKIIEKYLKNYVIIRTSIFGKNFAREGKSFAEWICESLRLNTPITMFTDIIFSPISVNTLSLLIDRLLDADFTGILNIGSSNAVSKYDFGIYLAGVFGFDKALISPASADVFPFKAKRPKNTSLDVSAAKRIFGALPSVEEEINVFHKRVSV